ncbi:MAG: PhnB protein [Actinomycetota bacterium]|jgi:PhnB protein|nr:PhnB protein [Actinomycetota bacterium]
MPAHERETTSIAPWLSVPDAGAALAFYRAAFGAVEIEHNTDDAGTLQVAQLWIGAADFWVQTDPDVTPDPAHGGSVRMILSVDDPDAVFTRAVGAGATVVNAMYEGHGWRIGRIADPFGHHWEIGRPLRS